MADNDTCEEEAVEAVLLLHRPRVFGGERDGWSNCVEDHQSWPCATAQAIERATGVGLRSMPQLVDQPTDDFVVDAAIVEFSGHVVHAGGGHVTISVDRDTVSYPDEGMHVDVYRAKAGPGGTFES